ncbi:hypothetical protein ACS0TY_003952 [Phlomoides rotata]
MSNCSGIPDVRCKCDRPTTIATTWKAENVGRRFFGCANYPNSGYCNYFQWIDDPVCDRAKQIIHGLLKKMNALTAENRELNLR